MKFRYTNADFDPTTVKAVYIFLCVFSLIAILITRIYKLAADPPGLFFDESSIGYNALSILKTGHDEHGVYFPLYFESVGDFKNPIYIYAVAGVFSIVRPSEFTLRMTSVLFFGLALLFTMLLISRLFNQNKVVNIFGLISFGFLPLFFVLSRISFEVVSQLCLVSLFTLLLWQAFHGDEKRSLISAGTAGVVLGLSTYSYTTQRLLSGLILVVVWLVFIKRENLKRLIILSTLFFFSFIPFLIFMRNHPGVATARFNELSFLDDKIRLSEKLSIFSANYFKYWSFDFLVLHGDPNLRHSTGHGGVVYISVFVLFLLGFLIVIWKRPSPDRFLLFLIAAMLISPIPAALITEGTPHALRSMLMVYFMLLISYYSLETFTKLSPTSLKIVVLGGMFLYSGYEISTYLRDYYFFYPSRSVEDLGSFDFRSALEFSLDQSPREILAVGLPPSEYAHVQFYSSIVENPKHVPISSADFIEPSPGMCILFHRRTDVESRLDIFSLPYESFSSRSKLDPLDKIMNLEKYGGVIKVRCYPEK